MTESAAGYQAVAPRFPAVLPGDDLPSLIIDALAARGLEPRDGDVIVLAQKIVSKAEGRLVNLASVEPGAEALALAARVLKDSRMVELVLRESVRVVRALPNLLIVEHRLGLIMANAGIDRSNVSGPAPGEWALLLPEDPDASAARLRDAMAKRTGAALGIVINDSFGRPWRQGSTGTAIGAAGIPSLIDLRGRPDLFGRQLEVTLVAVADEIAAAASLLMGQADEGRPIVLLRGLSWQAPLSPAGAIIRPSAEDAFR